MSQSSSSVIGIILPVVLAALIGTIFLGNIMGEVSGETSTRAVIDNQKEMQKLILYDAMIAYGCDTGGWIQDEPLFDKYWGDWADMQRYADDALGSDKISFNDLNSSMPRIFKGLPCRGTGSTLPGTGGVTSNYPNSPVSKEWRDDQEGTHSRIKFRINNSDSDSGPIEMPRCFTHYTHDNGAGQGLSGAQFEKARKDEVTNSWFLMSDAEEDSVFLRGKGWDYNGPSISCEYIVNGGDKNPNNGGSRETGGPAMNVEVILAPSVSGSLDTENEITINDINRFTDDEVQIKDYELPRGTMGYVQTNTGCKNKAGIHSVTNPPGVSEEIGEGDQCDNTLHPFIVITKIG